MKYQPAEEQRWQELFAEAPSKRRRAAAGKPLLAENQLGRMPPVQYTQMPRNKTPCVLASYPTPSSSGMGKHTDTRAARQRTGGCHPHTLETAQPTVSYWRWQQKGVMTAASHLQDPALSSSTTAPTPASTHGCNILYVTPQNNKLQ